jgi:predicted RNA polymerase sigma factor
MNTSPIITSSPVTNNATNVAPVIELSPKPVFVPMLVPRAHAAAANGNTQRDAAVIAHHAAVERLYTDARTSLVGAALRYVDDRDDAEDVVHEAFAVLLESPRRKPTRAALWCIVRDLARERRAERVRSEAYEEEDDVIEDAAGAWLERALRG